MQEKVLIADDAPAVVDVLTMFLEEVSQEVESTEEGARLAALPSGAPDLLLLDIRMSGCDGRDMCLHVTPLENHSQIDPKRSAPDGATHIPQSHRSTLEHFSQEDASQADHLVVVQRRQAADFPVWRAASAAGKPLDLARYGLC